MIRARVPRPVRLLALCLGIAPLLGGCSSLSRSFGFTRSSPNEFTVTTQPPLSMPPDLALRAPQPGAGRPQAVPASRAAEQALIPQSALAGPAPAGAGAGQQALVAAAGAAAGATAPGPQLGRPTTTRQDSFIHSLLFGGPGGSGGDVVNAPAEAHRLRENAALGRSPAAGATPVIAPEQPGLLDRIF